jgi:hypothetical protein
MKHLLISLTLVSGLAAAGPIDNMAAQCNAVMDSGLCKVALDPKDYPNATIPIILPSGLRRISTATYLAVRATGFEKDEQGRWIMCKKVYEACQVWESDACVTVRSLWKQ